MRHPVRHCLIYIILYVTVYGWGLMDRGLLHCGIIYDGVRGNQDLDECIILTDHTSTCNFCTCCWEVVRFLISYRLNRIWVVMSYHCSLTQKWNIGGVNISFSQYWPLATGITGGFPIIRAMWSVSVFTFLAWTSSRTTSKVVQYPKCLNAHVTSL